MLSVTGITRSFDSTPVLRGVDLKVERGEIVCLLGASGSGKSTLLRIVAGLDRPDAGDVQLEGRSILKQPVHTRDFGLMFQDFALFPHLNVAQNVEFGLRMRQIKPGERQRRVSEVLALVNLSGFERRDVAQLSGGERQRVALARSLAPNPRLLMLDEPLGALDAVLRERLILELRDIIKAVGLTAVYVTHDRREAFAVADRLAIMESGIIAQIGTPMEVYHRPTTVFAARLLGLGNVVTVTDWRDGQANTALGSFPLDQRAPALLLHPDGITLGGDGNLRGTVTEAVFQGDALQVSLEVNGVPLAFKYDSRRVEQPPRPGEPIALSINPAYVLPLKN
ncbi:MAG: ABC transporter ATP-binding protein [Anaerolineae bacterium]|nr:ABC transporter ATP-binding protein [Anaerolineae bacterium]